MIDQTVPTISRKYRGKKGMKEFQYATQSYAQQGYAIVSQVQTPGGRTKAASLFAFVGVTFLLLGLIIPLLLVVGAVCLVIGLASGKSDGELVVVWRLDAPAAAAPPQAPVGPRATTPLEVIDHMAAMRDRGLITADEFEAKKAELLGRL